MNTFQDAVKTKRFTLAAQLRLDEYSDRSSVLGQAEDLAGLVDGIQVTDNQSGLPHMAPLVAAGFLLEYGADPIVHLTCRNRNRLALQSELLGAASLGVTSLLLQRGDKRKSKEAPKTKQVFDIRAKRLIATAQTLNQLRSTRNEPELFLGTIATIFDPTEDWTPEKLGQRIHAGARFVQTQMCCNVDLLTRYMERLVSSQLTRRCHVLVSVPVLQTAESARWIAENIRGNMMPPSVVARLESAKQPEQEGIRIAVETIEQIQEIPGVSGANLISPDSTRAIAETVKETQLNT